MEYRKYGETVYARMDRGDEIIGCIKEICKKEQISAAVFSGIGGCSEAEIQTFLPDKGEFETRTVKGMLELVSMTGNIITDSEMNYYSHTHAVFAYKKNGEHLTAAGHIRSTTVLYTAEIEIRPVTGGAIKRRYNAETGTGFWSFSD